MIMRGTMNEKERQLWFRIAGADQKSSEDWSP